MLQPLPPSRRDPRDVSLCSPFVLRWLELKQQQRTARGGSRPSVMHRIRISSNEAREEAEQKLHASGAQTYRSVRREMHKRVGIRMSAL